MYIEREASAVFFLQLCSAALPSEHSLDTASCSPKVSICNHQPITKSWVIIIFMVLFHILFSMMLAWFLPLVVFGYVWYNSLTGNCFWFSIPYVFLHAKWDQQHLVRTKDTEEDENRVVDPYSFKNLARLYRERDPNCIYNTLKYNLRTCL